jgi:hypothetical protein
MKIIFLGYPSEVHFSLLGIFLPVSWSSNMGNETVTSEWLTNRP